jgi:catechol 2,3-dioxygenase-like lactoylglutathione lyase family enzyme
VRVIPVSVPMQIQRTNIILYCQPWAEVVTFYRDRLGLPIAWQNDWLVEFQLTPNSFLSIALAGRATVGATVGQGITLTWQVADVAQQRAAWLAQGVEISPVQVRWGSQVCYFRDPVGNRIELWGGMDE